MEELTIEKLSDDEALEVIEGMRWFEGKLHREVARGIWRPVRR